MSDFLEILAIVVTALALFLGVIVGVAYVDWTYRIEPQRAQYVAGCVADGHARHICEQAARGVVK